MPPLPSMEIIRYRPPSSSPEANRPCARELLDVRVSRRVVAARGVCDAATVCVAKYSVPLAAPHDAQNRPAPASSLPHVAHWAIVPSVRPAGLEALILG